MHQNTRASRHSFIFFVRQRNFSIESSKTKFLIIEYQLHNEKLDKVSVTGQIFMPAYSFDEFGIVTK